MAEPNLEILGRYKILKVLGKGAMGVVYQAIDPVIDRVVAIKTINLSLSKEEMKEYEARFQQEIKAAGRLNHPNIVTIYDVGKTDDFAYMAMEFIDGKELKDLFSEDARPDVLTTVEMMAQIADGLAFAHSKNIIHRDIKPSNIMVVQGEDGMVAKITDFGIARVAESAVKTMTGMIMGSPRYMSPEQVIGKNLSPGSDIFSLGVVLYETLTGDAPFDGDSVNAIMYATVNTPENPPSRLNRMVPPALDAIVARALAKTPETRYQSAKEFARALREVKQVVVSYIAPPAPEPAPPAPVLETASQQTAFTAAPPQDKDRQMKLSARFDSTVGTLRLAAFTKQTPELEKFISESRRMPAYKGAADAAAAPEALPPLKADVAAGRAAERAQGSLAQVNPALSAKLKGADAPGASTQGGTMGVSRKVPMVPLLLLGGLASTVIALSIVLLAGGM